MITGYGSCEIGVSLPITETTPFLNCLLTGIFYIRVNTFLSCVTIILSFRGRQQSLLVQTSAYFVDWQIFKPRFFFTCFVGSSVAPKSLWWGWHNQVLCLQPPPTGPWNSLLAPCRLHLLGRAQMIAGWFSIPTQATSGPQESHQTTCSKPSTHLAGEAQSQLLPLPHHQDISRGSSPRDTGLRSNRLPCRPRWGSRPPAQPLREEGCQPTQPRLLHTNPHHRAHTGIFYTFRVRRIFKNCEADALLFPLKNLYFSLSQNIS